MKGICPFCEQERLLEHVTAPENITVRGESIEVESQFLKCASCGNTFDDPQSEFDPLVVAYREYRKRHGGRDPIPQAAAMYETIIMLKQVIEKNGVTNKGSDLASDRDKIQKGLAGLKDFKGLTGNLTMSPGGTVSKEAYVIVVKDGKFVMP